MDALIAPGVSRRFVIVALALVVLVPALAALQVSPATPPSGSDFRDDFQALIRDVSETYAYSDRKATRWIDIPALYAADLAAVKTRPEFIRLLERVLDEFYDAHMQLTVNNADSPRLVPSGTDIWAEWADGQAVVLEIRRSSDAERAGIKAGDVITTFNGVPMNRAVDLRVGKTVPPGTVAARDWALRAVIAGRHNEARRLGLVRNGTPTTVDLPAADQFAIRPPQRVEHTALAGGVGYIRINDSLGASETVEEFDRALDELQQTRAVVIDLRDTASGGNSSVARGILGRFIDRELPYQKHVLPAEERETGIRRSWFELVSPRGPGMYARPIAVLVDHWTGSMGEGLAIGFNAVRGAPVVGTRMAGLLGATDHLVLPHTGIGVNVPAEQLFHVNGTPRESFRPTVEVDLSVAPTGRDPVLDAALAIVRQ